MAPIGSEIEKQKKIIADTKRKIEDLKAKEAKRILRIAEKVGYFNVSVTDQQLEAGMQQIVRTATTVSTESSKHDEEPTH